ncbi:hypothetical protein F5884DRAFT_816669 [Xylogone sp. PMI_703]|nr:hypothetical protein F5884DRAFT_816669 [Xylogone sp. PMI_703]
MSSSPAPDQSRRVVPAQLGFLAIYNPSLGKTDESLEDQLVYYSSLEDRTRGRRRRHGDKAVSDAERRQDRNEQLRNIGLGQGMVEFARSFSNGKPMDTVETHKSRILTHELEAGWWILASINLTQIPTTYTTPAAKGKPAEKKEVIEFSSREVKPPILLLGDLLRAHTTFLLHNDSSLSSLFERLTRPKFIGLLERYWDMFLSTWNVLMHGNPANSLYGGIKLAACGELGVGVGEEERGSGEREALEGFTGHIEGLVDVVVSKFGDVDVAQSPAQSPSKRKESKDRPQPKQDGEPWLGTGDDPSADDGAIFLGVGTLSRKSVRDVTHWMEDLYRWGPHAYGIIDNTATRKARKSKRKQSNSSAGSTKGAIQAEVVGALEARARSHSPPEEAPLTRIDPMPIDMETPDDNRSKHKDAPTINHDVPISDSEVTIGNKFVQYLTLGYGVPWPLGGSSPKPEEQEGITGGANGSAMKEGAEEKDALIFPRNDSVGHFLIGLMGDMENVGDHELENTEHQFNPLNGAESYHERLQLRTLTVDLENAEATVHNEASATAELGSLSLEDPTMVDSSEPTKPSTTSENPGFGKTKKLRVVVYVNKPFIFTFLFELSASCVASTRLYHSLHLQLKALVKPLLRSTKYRPTKPKVIATAADAKLPIYDLLYDPKTLTISSTIPNIPDPYLLVHARARSIDNHSLSSSSSWSRIEALNTHSQIINTYVAVNSDDRPRLELERTVKTGRGWWIVWTRVPDLDPDHHDDHRDPTAAPSVSPTSEEPPSSYDVDGDVSEDGSRSEQKSAGNTNEDDDDNSGGDKSGNNSGETEKRKPTAGSVHPFLQPYGRDKEIFLIRRASDNAESVNRAASLVSAVSGGRSEGWMGGTTRLAQGIGVDTRRYIEGLLNLNRQ